MASWTNNTARRRYRMLPMTFRTIRAARTAAAVFAMAAAAVAVVAGGTAAALAGVFLGVPVEDVLATSAVFGSVGALVAGALVLAIFPSFTRLMSMREDVQLLEAASPLHPLLKRLMAEAPGTYMHSLAVASLAEAGAEAIGADALVARVGSYYHDVGKVLRPCFFFENQEGASNPHDLAKPSISATIITAHVREGLELAAEYQLPDRVREIVGEHHGTSLVRYFYHRASQDDAAVYEADFRYQGTRPQSKESALVMLADGSEAAVRALGTPSRRSVETAIRAVIDERRADGQLDDSGLTDDDVDLIVESFGRVLMSLYHLRCEYPAPEMEGSCADKRCQPPGA